MVNVKCATKKRENTTAKGKKGSTYKICYKPKKKVNKKSGYKKKKIVTKLKKPRRAVRAITPQL
tara:strand:- start:190 stop:381 length:192 start_codon:yes stop_codon:yes gene_type:complete